MTWRLPPWPTAISAALWALILLILAACAPKVQSECPPIRAYTPEFSAQLADEIEASAPDTVWPLAVADYYVLRRQLEACQP